MSATAATATPTAQDPRILRECVATLYRQIPNSFVAAMGVTLYMAVTLWDKEPVKIMALWLTLQALAQVYRFWIYRSYQRATLDLDNAPQWARRYAQYMAVAGLVWGSAAFFFINGDAPLAVALTMCGLYGISGGAVPGNAYYPPAIYAFVWVIFGSVMTRMLMIGGVDYIALGVASVFFALILTLFCRIQYRTLVEGFVIRFERAELISQLELQKAQAEQARHHAEQANLAKSQFLAAASHDLRQPLHALTLFSASLQDLRLDAQGQAIVGRMQRNIGALEDLFNSLLDISKLDAGAIQPNWEPVPVAALFTRLQEYFLPQAREKGLELIFVPPQGAVRADAALLERILGNLIANAIRYTSEGRVLIASRRAATGQRWLEVRDSGIGIAAADSERIFEEFVQIGNPERDRRKGLGLGLAIAQRTAALLGSAIELRSAPGRGSVFRLLLDRAELAPSAPAAERAAVLDRMSGLRVLVLDDEETVRDGFHALLGRWGASVEALAEPADALMKIKDGARYDVLLADHRLRAHQNGLDAIAQLRAAHPAPLSACLITGDTDPALISRAAAAGVPLLHKPVKPAQLRALLNHLLSESVPIQA